MCLAAILVTNLDQREQNLLKHVGDGRYFGVSILNNFGGVPVVRKLQTLKLARQADFHPKYGTAQWVLTHCGIQAAKLLVDLDKMPLLQQQVKDTYNQTIKNCPLSRKPNPDDWCNCAY